MINRSISGGSAPVLRVFDPVIGRLIFVASAAASVLLEGSGLVDGLAARLLALDQVLRVVLVGTDGAPGVLGVRGDLLLDRALGGAAVRLPLDVVTLGEFVSHAARRTPSTGFRPRSARVSAVFRTRSGGEVTDTVGARRNTDPRRTAEQRTAVTE